VEDYSTNEPGRTYSLMLGLRSAFLTKPVFTNQYTFSGDL